MSKIIPFAAFLALSTACGGLETYPPIDTARQPFVPSTGTIGTYPGTGGGGTTLGVEICDDLIDNDGDNEVDCNDADCDTTCDGDGDGYIGVSYGGDDCNDTNDQVHPGEVEICDGLDNDCNGGADNDTDGDGWAVCDDCNDSAGNVFPGAQGEVCNDGIDTNCDGADCPPVPVWTQSFEAGFNGGWTHSGNSYWVTVGNASYDGVFSVESGPIGDSQTSEMSIPVTYANAGTISFWHKGDTENNYDYLRFYIDGTQVFSRAGSWGWASANFNVGAGVHTFKWVYDKDGSVSVGQDKTWVDLVVADGGVL